MNVCVAKIYYQLPAGMQNIFLSSYGLYLQKIRHGQQYRDFCRQVNGHLALSKGELAGVQWQGFCKLLADSRKYVPYYRKALKDISAPEVKCLDDLRKLPLLEKEVLRTSPETLVDERYEKKKLLVVHTTGTTGTPLKIYCTPDVRKKNYAFYRRFLQQAGINYSGRRATFGGRIIVPHNQKQPPFWRYSYFQKNILFSSYHLTEKNIPSYITALRKIRPEYIDTYPSSLFTLAKYAVQQGISLKGISRAIITSAETLFPEQRKIIEDVFDAQIFDQYGAAEMCVFVGQCGHGSYHVHSDYAIIEFLREDGSRAVPGEEAEVVCTGLINPVMPLIRYRIGDRAVLSDRECECGSPFPVVEKIIGRADDVILTPDGRRIGRLSPVLKGFPVKEAQYRQKVIDEIDVLLVKDQGFSVDTEKNIIMELKKRLGGKIKINIKYVEVIERSKGGKLKSIISEL